MHASIRPVEYFYMNVKDEPGEGHRVLSALANEGVDLVAFNAIPMGDTTQLVLFPSDPPKLRAAARHAGLILKGPHHAFLIAGDDHLGAFAEIHGRLAGASINVVASYGMTDGRGGFGYVMYLRPDDFEPAARVLQTLTEEMAVRD